MNFLLFYNGPYAGLIYLEIAGNHSCKPQSMVHIKWFHFSGNIMTFLCFLRSFFASVAGLSMDPMELVKVYSIAQIWRKMHQNCERWYFAIICNLLERGTAHTEVISVTWHFKQTFATLELTAIATAGGYKIIPVVLYVLQLVVYTYDLTLHLYIYYISLNCRWFHSLQMFLFDKC